MRHWCAERLGQPIDSATILVMIQRRSVRKYRSMIVRICAAGTLQ